MIRWYEPGISTIRWLGWQQVCNVCSEASSPSMSSLPSIDVSSPCFIPENSDRTFFRLQNSEKQQYYHVSEYLEQFFDKFHERNSHEVQGNPPKAATGWVAAVEHIHLIYMNINFKVNKLCCSENSWHALLLSKISYTILIFRTWLQMLILLHDGSGIRQGVCVSISIDVCFKYKALMLTFGRGRESRSRDQLKKMQND